MTEDEELAFEEEMLRYVVIVLFTLEAFAKWVGNGTRKYFADNWNKARARSRARVRPPPPRA